MNQLCEKMRSKKDPHCAWSIRRDVGWSLRKEEAFLCSCYCTLLARGQILESTGTCPFIPCRSLSVKAVLKCLWDGTKGFTYVKSSYLSWFSAISEHITSGQGLNLLA